MPVDSSDWKLDLLIGIIHGWSGALILTVWILAVEILFGPFLQSEADRTIIEVPMVLFSGATVAGVVLGLLARRANAWWKAALVGVATAVPAYGSVMYLWMNSWSLLADTSSLWIPIAIVIGLVVGPFARRVYRKQIPYWV